MTDHGIDWDEAFTNMDFIPDGPAFPPRWMQAAKEFRESHARSDLDLVYGASEREVFDIFYPAKSAKGLLVFVHGGYWMKFDKSVWSHLAVGPLMRGWAVAMPSYTLAPQARISQITQQIVTAIETAASLMDGPIRLAGHSAGGHLVSRMLCSDIDLGAAAARIAHVMSISGVHDLTALQLTKLNDELQITPSEASSESPAKLIPRKDVPVTCWVGGDERPEFMRQNQLLAEAWSRSGVSITNVADPRKHHFDVIDGLTDPNSPLCNALLGD